MQRTKHGNFEVGWSEVHRRGRWRDGVGGDRDSGFRLGRKGSAHAWIDRRGDLSGKRRDWSPAHERPRRLASPEERARQCHGRSSARGAIEHDCRITSRHVTSHRNATRLAARSGTQRQFDTPGFDRDARAKQRTPAEAGVLVW